jgi:hypothetical protein
MSKLKSLACPDLTVPMACLTLSVPGLSSLNCSWPAKSWLFLLAVQPYLFQSSMLNNGKGKNWMTDLAEYFKLKIGSINNYSPELTFSHKLPTFPTFKFTIVPWRKTSTPS